MKESKLGVKLISLFKPARITLCLNLAPVLVKKLMFLKGVNEGNTFGWFYTLRHFASTKIAGIYKKIFKVFSQANGTYFEINPVEVMG